MTKKERVFRKIKKKGSGGGFIAMLLVSLLLGAGIYILCVLFVFLILRSNLHSEYENIRTAVDLYEKDMQPEQIAELLGGESRDFVIKDASGKIQTASCEDTIAEEGQEVSLQLEEIIVSSEAEEDGGEEDAGREVTIQPVVISDEREDGGLDITVGTGEDISEHYSFLESKVMVHADKKIPVLFPKRGNLSVDVKAFYRYLDEDEDATKNFSNGKEPLELPFWIEFPVKDGSQVYYGKGTIFLTVENMFYFLIVTAAISILLVIAMIVFLFSFFGALRKQKKLVSLLFMDEVTGGHNWMWFLIKAGQFLRRHRNDKFNYAICDLVFVNYRNYCMCHSVAEGERLLAAVDCLVNGSLNRKTEACAHFASANFGLMLRYGTRQELEKRLENLIAALEQIDRGHNFSFHIGVFMLPATTNAKGRFEGRRKLDLDEAYNNACTARSTLADNDSSAIAFFDEELVKEQKWLDIVQEEQKKALINEEFLVYYQPKYNPVTNILTGAEALIRWDSPKYGFLSPGRFIPIFEKNGFITEIDHYMLSHVAMDQKRWLDEGRKCVPVSVNVSRAHFIESDLAEQIRDIVDEAGAPHELIEIELTESAFFDDKKAIIDVICKLKSYGFTVSMDDFGSGYSSLNSLKDMPLDVLKLDAEFFRGDNAGERGEIVVKEALRLAKALNMKTVAEGIEAREQVEFLADQGCDMIQGYIFAHPMPPEKYENAMKEEKAEPVEEGDEGSEEKPEE